MMSKLHRLRGLLEQSFPLAMPYTQDHGTELVIGGRNVKEAVAATLLQINVSNFPPIDLPRQPVFRSDSRSDSIEDGCKTGALLCQAT